MLQARPMASSQWPAGTAATLPRASAPPPRIAPHPLLDALPEIAAARLTAQGQRRHLASWVSWCADQTQLLCGGLGLRSALMQLYTCYLGSSEGQARGRAGRCGCARRARLGSKLLFEHCWLSQGLECRIGSTNMLLSKPQVHSPQASNESYTLQLVEIKRCWGSL